MALAMFRVPLQNRMDPESSFCLSFSFRQKWNTAMRIIHTGPGVQSCRVTENLHADFLRSHTAFSHRTGSEMALSQPRNTHTHTHSHNPLNTIL